jgi:hypothetical protein
VVRRVPFSGESGAHPQNRMSKGPNSAPALILLRGARRLNCVPSLEFASNRAAGELTREPGVAPASRLSVEDD